MKITTKMKIKIKVTTLAKVKLKVRVKVQVVVKVKVNVNVNVKKGRRGKVEEWLCNVTSTFASSSVRLRVSQLHWWQVFLRRRFRAMRTPKNHRHT